MTEHGPDFIVSELLSELKSENSRKDGQIKSLHKVVAGTVATAIVAVLLTVAGFLWYLNQYDFSSTNSVMNTAEGVYAIVDSSGNVVGRDLTAEQLERLMEVVENGTSPVN